MDENILVFPNRIRFGVDSHGRLIEECLTISSAWSEPIAFRIKPSVVGVLSLPTSSGFLQPFQSIRIPVSSLKSVTAATFRMSINVDVAPYDADIAKESDDFASSSDLFWVNHRRHHTTRIITCECMKEGDAEPDSKDASSHDRQRGSSPGHSTVHPPRGHILNLMVKNVSKDDPLTSSEKEELKAIRGLMTAEQWTSWLVYARAEKKARGAEAGTIHTPTLSTRREVSVAKSTPSSLVQHLLASTNAHPGTANRPVDIGRSRSPPLAAPHFSAPPPAIARDSSQQAPKSPLAEKSPKSPARRYDMHEGIAQREGKLASPSSKERRSFSRAKSPPSMEKNRPAASSQPRAAPAARPSSAPRLRGGAGGHESAPGGVACGTPRRFDEMKQLGGGGGGGTGGGDRQTPGPRLAQSQSQFQSRPRPRSESPDRPQARGEGGGGVPRRGSGQDRAIGDIGLGSNHDSSGGGGGGGVGRGSGSRSTTPNKERDTMEILLSSAAPPIQTPYFMEGLSSRPPSSLRRPTLLHDSPPASSHNDTKKPSTKKDPANSFIHNKQVHPPLGGPDNFRHQLYSHSNSQKSTGHPPEHVYKSPASTPAFLGKAALSRSSHSVKSSDTPAHTLSHNKSTGDLFISSSFIADDFSSDNRDDDLVSSHSLSPSARAAARASALRIDSAYAAAECIRASFKADSSSSGGAHNKDSATTLAMLDVMMKSLEKSKQSLNDILHSPGRDRSRESMSSSNSDRAEKLGHQRPKGRSPRDNGKRESPDSYQDKEDISEDRSSAHLKHHSHRKRNSYRPSDGFGRDAPTHSPDMEMMRTNELNGSLDSDEEDREGLLSARLGGGFFPPSSSKRGYSESSSRGSLSPSRVYRSALVDSSTGGGFGDTATKSDFKELQRFGGKSSGRLSAAADDDDTSDYDGLHNTTSSENRNMAAAVVARYKQSKAGQAAQLDTPRVWRICLSQGPLQKAFEENPIRFDVENSTIDVVWRDSRIAINSSVRGEYSHNAKASTLRRERFHFNESYAGPGGLGKLCAYARQRVKRSVQTGRGVAFVCVAAGDGEAAGAGGQVEPPVSVVLGDCGGQGLISSVVEALFRYISPRGYPCKQADQTMHRKYGGKNAPPLLASTAALTETTSEPVLFSAVVISEGSIVDLLGPSGSLVYRRGSNTPGQHQHKKCKVHRRANGSSYIAHMTRLQLHSVADFERVAGVLLGRRSALREMVPVMDELLSALPYSDAAEGDMSVPDTPWLLSGRQEATLLFTVTTKTYSSALPSVHGQASDLNYYFTCPCGDNWSLPGNELCLLSEGISALPHSPAPSLQQAGVLPQLLLDSCAAPIDYVNVAAVIRSEADISPSRQSSEKSLKAVQNSLHSFRVVTSDS